MPKCQKLFDLASARFHGPTRRFKRLIDELRKSWSHAMHTVWIVWMHRIMQRTHALRGRAMKFLSDCMHSTNILIIKIK
jgi:hypothetical protein